MILTDEEIEYMDKRLHSPDMLCRQCDITRRMLLAISSESGESR